jgi:hypothetical protein
MSTDSPTYSPSPDAGHEAAPLDWFLAMLREAMVGVMADAPQALKKANALARLGNLYLKTYGVAELKRTNAELEERVAELEEWQATLGVETAAGEEEAAGQTAPEEDGSAAPRRTEKAKPSKPRSHGGPRPARGRRPRPGPRQKKAG